MLQTNELFQKKISKKIEYRYCLYLPKEYGKEPKKKWPLVLFLHGSGGRGDDIEKIKVHGIPKMISEGKHFPFIAVCPQCKANSFWIAEIESLDLFLNEMIESLPVDQSRVYLTGLSMGGFGTWGLAMAHPEKFAAIVPVCGGGMSWNAERLKDIPVWAFHGDKDPIVPYVLSVQMVEALQKCGGNVKFTTYPNVGHDAWTDTFSNPEVYEWMLSQKKN